MKAKRADKWPKEVTEGRETVTVYRRMNGAGIGYRVADYSTGKRRFLSYASEAEAMDEARRIAKRLAERDVVGASIRGKEAASYAAAVQTLAPYGVTLPAVADVVAEALKLTGSLSGILQAAEVWAREHRQVTRKSVADVVRELLELKERRNASRRYLMDLRSRLGRFADSVRKDACDVSTTDVQAFLDSLKAAPQSLKNFRTVLHGLFAHAVARGFASQNPVTKTQAVEVRSTGAIAVFTPTEFRRLLEAATPEFLPILVLGGLAGLRSAELERVRWEDLDLEAGHVVLSAVQAKTASRRVVPLCTAAVAWLKPVAKESGKVWANPGLDTIFKGQDAVAEASGVAWKANGLRHSYASYRFALVADAGRVAGELGNSPAVVHRHYKELVKPADAKAWFAILPASGENVVAAEFGG